MSNLDQRAEKIVAAVLQAKPAQRSETTKPGYIENGLRPIRELILLVADKLIEGHATARISASLPEEKISGQLIEQKYMLCNNAGQQCLLKTSAMLRDQAILHIGILGLDDTGASALKSLATDDSGWIQAQSHLTAVLSELEAFLTRYLSMA